MTPNPAALAAQIAASKRAQLERLAPRRQEARAHLETLRAEHQDQAAELKDAAEVRELSAGHAWDLYPTPRDLAERMAQAAELAPGLAICEPSAGTGRIAEAIRAEGRECECVEISQALAERLRGRGYLVTRADFLEWQPAARYDRFVMNPPFSKGQDIAHVRHAWDLLAPGGRIVAIMSEGPFFRPDRQATEFRDWLETTDYTAERLPADTFKSSGANVACRLVIIDKP